MENRRLTTDELLKELKMKNNEVIKKIDKKRIYSIINWIKK